MNQAKKIFTIAILISIPIYSRAQSSLTDSSYISPEEIQAADPGASGDPFADTGVKSTLPVVPSTPTKPDANSMESLLESEVDANALGDTKTPVQDEALPAFPESAVKAPKAAKQFPLVEGSIPPPPRPNAPAVEYIDHPLSKQGLYLIDEEGRYHYKTYEFEKTTQSSWIHVGSATPTPDIVAADGVTTYEDLYTPPPYPIVQYDYEWQPFQKFGKLGLQLGFGAFFSKGRGQYTTQPSDPDCSPCEPEEEFTFVGVPLSANVVYRFEYSSRQWLVPYVGGGGSYYALVEVRQSGGTPKGVGTPALTGFGGAMLSVSRLDPSARYTLISEYGIQNLWFGLEYRVVQGLSEELDVSANILALALVFDY